MDKLDATSRSEDEDEVVFHCLLGFLVQNGYYIDNEFVLSNLFHLN